MTKIFSLSIILLFFTSCNENSQKKSIEPAPDEETVSVVVEKNTSPGSSLVDLSKEKNIQALLCQGWVMDDDIAVIESNGNAQGTYPVRCLYLFDDLTYTRNVRNFMEYGKWAYDDKNKLLTVKEAEGSKDAYKIAAIGPDDMIVLNNENKSSTKLTFIGSGKRYAVKKEDPFYIDNNRWRIKPGAPENDEQIRKRLKDCLHFYILFYRDNIARHEKKISFYGLPTCIRWYGGGIYMVKETDLADNWFECFYNKEQAMKAYRLMGKIITMKYTWSKGNESWVKKNLGVLEQMYANL
jgi:hypothetical protein